MDGSDHLYRFEIEFDSEKGLVRTEHFGRSTADGLKRFIDALLTDPRWRPGMNVITDFRNSDPSLLSAENLRDCVAYTIGYVERTVGTKVATVVDSPLSYGISRIWGAQIAMQGAPTEFRIFDTEKAAERWLTTGRRMAKSPVHLFEGPIRDELKTHD